VLAFISYSSEQKAEAAQIRAYLKGMSIESFMAHEDIAVSEEWRLELIDKIKSCDVFVAILSDRYIQSVWCMQESGMAVLREMTIIPISLDGTPSPGFMSHMQSKRIDLKNIDMHLFLKPISRHNAIFVTDKLINKLENSNDYRSAEYNFYNLMQYSSIINDKQIQIIIECIKSNGQINFAHLCRKNYIPAFIKAFSDRISPELVADLSQYVDDL
jgi:TIR domain